jgi:hypothetical protein
MNGNTETLNRVIVGLMDLVREVRMHGRTARFDMRAPGLLEEAMLALKHATACASGHDAAGAMMPERVAAAAWPERLHS